jgi:hypothetical protein
LTVLRIDVKNEGGQLFYMALLTFISCLILEIYEDSKLTNVIAI